MIVFSFELDNFELYSGTPANFTIRTVDKYTNNLEQWTNIGRFEASDKKMQIQQFSGLNVKNFGKFARIDLETYHGSEHYCTLTNFRYESLLIKILTHLIT